MVYFSEGSRQTTITREQASAMLDSMLKTLGNLERVLLVPPDYTRLHSGAGELTVMLFEKLKERAQVEIMPALGTHLPVTDQERIAMFPGIPKNFFRVHDWRNDVVRIGEVPAGYIRDVSEGKLEFPLYCEINRTLVDDTWDRIFSIGQLVPHELAGIANFSKNILIGTGGEDTIAKTHYIAAVYGLERLIGRIENPMRKILRYMEQNIIAHIPVSYIMTVRGHDDSGNIVTRGLFGGDDKECYRAGAELCQELSITFIDRPVKKVVVYMDPEEFKTTWVGNKSIFRTRMIIENHGEIVILAPGVKQFGEDARNDGFIRKFGYHDTDYMVNCVNTSQEAASNITAVSHIIISSPENRFTVTYCPGHLSRAEVESVNFNYADCSHAMKRYNPENLRPGYNVLPDGEEIYFVAHPAQGLWAVRDRFREQTRSLPGETD
ncbi:MAG: DUF2088 domain-containing protein [Chitinivibrionales bacterium]|nr:DUF2088 domain-containing protein [Chitinivibrionales bacterium]